jgi:hypothetical protein
MRPNFTNVWFAAQTEKKCNAIAAPMKGTENQVNSAVFHVADFVVREELDARRAGLG